MNFLYNLWANQVAQPSGLAGKLMGVGMARDNRRLVEWTLDLLAIQPTDNVLEIGFGRGVSIQRAVKEASQGLVAGIELSEIMVKEARKLNSAAIAASRADIRLGNVTSLPFGDGNFDKVFAVNVLYFWEDPIVALQEMKRVIKPGGCVALGFIDKEDFKKQKFTQTRLFTLYSGEEALELLREAGFSDTRCEAKPVHRAGLGLCAMAIK
jgi:ubiquinone/menaquinone biosynthesis C-methylase UbiE